MFDDPCNARRRSRAELEAAWVAAGGKVVRGNSWLCAFHDECNPSAGPFERDQIWRARCFGCNWSGDVFDIEAKATGKTAGELMSEYRKQNATNPKVLRRERTKDKRPPKIHKSMDSLKRAAVYLWGKGEPSRWRVYDDLYRGVDGKPGLVVLRGEYDDGKKIAQAHHVEGGIVLKKPKGKQPMANRQGIAAAHELVFVEGEECAIALQRIGIPATTWPGGSNADKRGIDWTPANGGGRVVYLWPDHDADCKGVRAMREVQREIESLPDPPMLRWIDPEATGVPNNGGDVVDLMNGYDTDAAKLDAVREVMARAELLDASRGVLEQIRAEAEGRRESVPTPWRIMDNITMTNLPGMATMLCGSPGASKSFLLLQAALHWFGEGYRCAAMMMEQDRDYHLRRALAQLAGDGRLTNSKWCKANADIAEDAYHRHAETLHRFARCIHSPGERDTMRDLLAWMRDQTDAGARMLAIDPITAATVSESRWLDDQQFVREAGRILDATGASLWLVTHPKALASARPTLDDLAGGKVYQRLVQSVLYLEHHPEPKDVMVRTTDGSDGDPSAALPMTTPTEINRTLRVLKTRNGTGQGWGLGCWFDKQTLTIRERGIIVNTSRAANNEGAERYGSNTA